MAKTYSDSLARLDKDFTYLKNPSLLPRGYEQSLIEVRRRKKFRRMLEEDMTRIKKYIDREKS